MTRFALLAAFAFNGCASNQPAPAPTPAPVPIVAGDASAPVNSCSAECARLALLKCREFYAATCVSDCEALDDKLIAHSIAPQNHACVSLAPTCDAARKCAQ